MLLLAAVLMAGCKKESDSENTETTETVGYKNPNLAQDTPLSENFLSEFQSVYQLYPNVDGSYQKASPNTKQDVVDDMDAASSGTTMEEGRSGGEI